MISLIENIIGSVEFICNEDVMYKDVLEEKEYLKKELNKLKLVCKENKELLNEIEIDKLNS